MNAVAGKPFAHNRSRGKSPFAAVAYNASLPAKAKANGTSLTSETAKAVLQDLVVALKATPIVTLAGSGGAYEFIENAINASEEK